MLDESKPAAAWHDEIFDLLKKHGVSVVSYVPDGGHKALIARCLSDPGVRCVPLTIEHEGVSLAAGVHLGGGRSVLLMQSSGVGNCINMLSLISHGRFPFLAIVSMRGEFGEGNPWQLAMGRGVEPTLGAMDVKCLRIDTPQDVAAAMTAALTTAFQAETPMAVLLSQRFLGAKKFRPKEVGR